MKVSAFQIPAGNKSAGAHTIRYVERVAHESILNRKTWQEASLSWGGHDCTVAYATALRMPTHWFFRPKIRDKKGPGFNPALVFIKPVTDSDHNASRLTESSDQPLSS
jgi:hypothetical protein